MQHTLLSCFLQDYMDPTMLPSYTLEDGETDKDIMVMLNDGGMEKARLSVGEHYTVQLHTMNERWKSSWAPPAGLKNALTRFFREVSREFNERPIWKISDIKGIKEEGHIIASHRLIGKGLEDLIWDRRIIYLNSIAPFTLMVLEPPEFFGVMSYKETAVGHQMGFFCLGSGIRRFILDSD